MSTIPASMQRRAFLATLASLGLISLLPGCRRAMTPLRVASYVWPGYGFLFLAEREGWFSTSQIELRETGSSTESLQLLASGQVDGAALTLDELLRARDQGVPLTAVLVFDISLGADVLLAHPSIATLAQLKGRRIGLEQTALGALMLHKALEVAGLQRADVITVPVTFDRHAEIWRRGEVDALITIEPVSTQLQSEGARLLFDSSEIPDTIIDLLALRPDTLEQHRVAVAQLVAAHFRGLENLRKNPYDTAYRMTERFNLTPKEIIASYRGLELPGVIRNRALLQSGNSTLKERAAELNEILWLNAAVKNRHLDLSRLTDDRFIPREARS